MLTHLEQKYTSVHDICKVLVQVPIIYGNVASLDLRWHLIERPETPTPVRKSSGKRSLEVAKKDLPIGRSAHSLVSHGQALYLFGGYGGEGSRAVSFFLFEETINMNLSLQVLYCLQA